MSEKIHGAYNQEYSFSSRRSSTNHPASYGYATRGYNPVTQGIRRVAAGPGQYPQGQNIGDIYDMRRQTMYQQLSYAGKLNPVQKTSYDDATKAKALGNFAELTDAQMEAAVLKNWEQKINNYIQIA